MWIFMVSCDRNVEDESWELTGEIFMSAYTEEKRAVDLSDTGLKWFVSLNSLNGDMEIVNIYVSNNDIEVLNITDYPDLLRIVADNNNFNYFWDLKLPSTIKHIDLSYNHLKSLEGVEIVYWTQDS